MSIEVHTEHHVDDSVQVTVKRGDTTICEIDVTPTGTSANAPPELKALDAFRVDVRVDQGHGLLTPAAHVKRIAYLAPET
jgi:hypothetical protein